MNNPVEKYICRTDLPVLFIYDINPTWEAEEIQDYKDENRVLIDALQEVGHPVKDVCIQTKDLKNAIRDFHPHDYVVFNRCEELPDVYHSEYRVAEILDEMGFCYTGANTQALILSQDKVQVKQVLKEQGIPVPTWQVYTSTKSAEWSHFPAIVKPAFEHCSFGITRESVVQSNEELKKRVGYVLDELNQPAIVERFIDGREFHIGVIGNDGLTALPPAEIDYSSFKDIHDRLCTYESNFDKTSLAYQLTLPKIPVNLSRDELDLLDELVLKAYSATDCRDYARMDVRLQDGEFYILDVNHNPDLSAGNSLVIGAEMIGLSFGQLGSLFINLAAQRHPVFGIISCEEGVK